MTEQALQSPPRDLGIITSEILFRKDRMAQNMMTDAAGIGKCLLEAKEQVPHGEWGKYLSETVDFSARTATNFMRIYKENSNRQALADLTYTQAVALFALPPGEREEFVQENDVANMSARQLQQAIKERDEALEDARRKQEELDAGRQAIEDAKALQEASLQVKNEAEERIRDAEQRAAESAKEAEEAKAAAKQKQQKAIDTAVKKATKEIEATNADLRQQLDQAKQLLVNNEKEIAEAKEEAKIAANNAAEEAREAGKAEMAEKDRYIADLERKLHSAGNSAVQRFAVLFEQLKTTYKDLLATVDAVEDPDQQARLREAISKVLQSFEDKLKGDAE